MTRRLLAILILLSSGCTSYPDTMGMRPDFGAQQIAELTILPAYSTSSFGLNDTEATYVRDLYEREVGLWLNSKAVEVVSSQQLQSSLRQQSALGVLQDGFSPTAPLYKLFEPSEGTFESGERRAIKVLARDGQLASDTLLVLEVIYHSEGECFEAAAEYTDRVWESGDPKQTPCILAHLRAKLILASSAETMWQNRALVEYRGPINPSSRLETIANAVRLTLGGKDGLTPYLASTPPSR